MSRHNRERKKSRQKATQSTPTGINRPNPGPAPAYRDDNPNPHTGESDGRQEPVSGEKHDILDGTRLAALIPFVQGLIRAEGKRSGFRRSGKRR